MNRKQKKDLRRHLSTRQLMGIDQLTEHGLKTAKGELVFYLLSPDNLSVLSSDGVRNRVRALTDLLRGLDAAELLALDSRESFQSNKNYYQTRLEQEEVPTIREMLRRNMAHLDGIQSTTASAREFVLVHRIDSKGQEKHVTQKFLTGKTLGENGSDLDRMFLVSAAITKAFHGDNATHARYMKIGGVEEDADGSVVYLSQQEKRSSLRRW